MCRHLVSIVLLFTCLHASAQRVGVYTFEKNFEERTNKFPTLKVLGKKGVFEPDNLPELNNLRRTVYVFEKNCGLQFDNKQANGFFNGSYTIEIYFKFNYLDSWKRVVDFKNRKTDYGCYIYDGKLNFYLFAIGDRAPVRPREYTHYVVSRNVKTNQFKMYVDGLSKVEFNDKGNEGVVDEDGFVNFFFDDLIVKDEASAGAVALIKIYDYLVEPASIKKSFAELEEEMKQLAQELPPEIDEFDKIFPKVVEPDEPFTLLGKVENEENKNAINNASITILDSNMVQVQKINLANNKVELPILPKKEYNLIVEAIGYVPIGLHLSADELKKRRHFDNIFMLQPISAGLAVQLNNLRFKQSEPELLPESNLELEKVVVFMRDNPKVEIEIHGHTDNQGDFDLNLELSRKRAEIVKTELVKRGIKSNRLYCKGYGGTRPIASNGREDSRRFNRRVELIINKY